MIGSSAGPLLAQLMSPTPKDTGSRDPAIKMCFQRLWDLPCAWFARSVSPTFIRFEPDWARVVSGVDEGVFGWIALNYATGHLAVNTAPATEAQSSAPDKSQAPGAFECTADLDLNLSI